MRTGWTSTQIMVDWTCRARPREPRKRCATPQRPGIRITPCGVVMPLPYPSAEDLHSWSLRLQYEANAEREATKRLETQYWNTDARDPTAVAALWQAFVQAEQVAQAFRTRVIADAVAYEDWVSPLAGVYGESRFKSL